MMAADLIDELKFAAKRRGYDLSPSSAGRLMAQIDLERLNDVPSLVRREMCDFLLQTLDVTFSNERNAQGQIILHEPDAERMINNIRFGVAAGRLRDLWCKIFIGGCP